MIPQAPGFSGKDFRIAFILLILLFLLLPSQMMGQVSVITQHNDNSRTGQNLNETILNTSNVNLNNFGKLFTLSVDGYVYAQPLYVMNVMIAGTPHNVVYVATEHNSVYAFDADDTNGTTLWSVSLNVNGSSSVPSDDICGGSPGCYTDLVPEVGITGTPVIDPAGNILYVAAKNKDADNSYHYRLHALDLGSGAEMLGGPVEISASGFNPFYHLNRPGLLLSGGKVYIAFGSLGDHTPYYGWVMAFDAGTLQQLAFLNTSPTSSGSALWAGGQGPVADAAGNVYVITANGTFNANTGGSDYGTSFLKLDGSSLNVLDYFTPDNQLTLGDPGQDIDLGAGGPMLIPDTSGNPTTLLLGGGKDGKLRLVDSSNMGQFNSGFNADVQEWQALSGRIMGGPVYWNSPSLGQVVYTWGDGQALKAWSFNGATFNTSPVSQSTILNVAGYSNMAPLSVSSNANTDGTGIVWAAAPLSGNANAGTVPGRLLAFDASDLTNELWDSQQNSARDGVGNFAKFNPPTVANGKVYLPTFSNQLVVYGLFTQPDFFLSPSSNSASVTAGTSAQYTVSVSSENSFNSAVALTCSVSVTGASCSFSPSLVTPSAGSPATAVLTVSTTTATIPGTYSVAISGASGTTTHGSSVSLTVQAPAADFALAASPLSASVVAGSSATSTVTVSPTGNFSGTVNLTCSIVTSAAHPPTCSLSPSSAVVNGGAVNSTLTVNTTGASASRRSSANILYAMWLPIGGVAFLGMGSVSRRKKLLATFMLVLMISGLVFLVACGGGGTSPSGGGGGGGGGTTGGTPSGTYNVTITATSGALTHSTTVTLTVQ